MPINFLFYSWSVKKHCAATLLKMLPLSFSTQNNVETSGRSTRGTLHPPPPHLILSSKEKKRQNKEKPAGQVKQNALPSHPLSSRFGSAKLETQQKLQVVVLNIICRWGGGGPGHSGCIHGQLLWHM